jgi:alanine dehydrogenase
MERAIADNIPMEVAMDIAIPRATLPDEQRIALTPAGVQSLISAGHRVYVDHEAGLSAGFTDNDFNAAGAQIVYHPEEIYRRGDLLVTVDGVPEAAERLLRPGQIICGFLRLTMLPQRRLAALAAAKVTTISYELIQCDNGKLPVLESMSEITGRLLPQLAAHLLETHSGGRGTLLAPIPGIPSAEVVILGAGVVGSNAAYGFTAWGVQTTVLDHNIDQLRLCERFCWGHVTTKLSTQRAIDHAVHFADVLIGAVHVPGSCAPQLVSKQQVAMMKPRSVVIDVAIDQGGCIATSRPTTLHDPTYMAEGVLHYAVPNIPSAVVRTATHALNNALLPYIQAIAEGRLDRAIAQGSALARGIGLVAGCPASPQIGTQLESTPHQTATQRETIT